MRCSGRESSRPVNAREDPFSIESQVFPGERDSLACQRDLKKATAGTQREVGRVT